MLDMDMIVPCYTTQPIGDTIRMFLCDCRQPRLALTAKGHPGTGNHQIYLKVGNRVAARKDLAGRHMYVSLDASS